jgi:hypothetical protein
LNIDPLCLCLIVASASLRTFAAEIRVPEDSSTIQEGIDAAADGDVVRVSAGVYRENITFRGKDISVESRDGPEVTTILGDGTNAVVRFETREPLTATLSGFTIRGGHGVPVISAGGGVFVFFGASATIRNTVIVENRACNGGGIAVYGGPVLLESNFIANNEPPYPLCKASLGGGIYLARGSKKSEVLGNVIYGNISSMGGGVFVFGTAIIRDNLISDNVSSMGGGINLTELLGEIYANGVSIIENVIVRNRATWFGGGVALSVAPRIFVNNTIADNDISWSNSGGSAMGIGSLVTHTETFMANNTFASNSLAPTLWVDQPSSPPTFFTNNNSWNALGPPYGGNWPDQTGELGNNSADPLFIDSGAGDYHLQDGSPCIDNGRNDVPGLAEYDFEGNPRIVDGSGIGSAIIDLGAYEFQPIKNR